MGWVLWEQLHAWVLAPSSRRVPGDYRDITATLQPLLDPALGERSTQNLSKISRTPSKPLNVGDVGPALLLMGTSPSSCHPLLPWVPPFPLSHPTVLAFSHHPLGPQCPSSPCPVGVLRVSCPLSSPPGINHPLALRGNSSLPCHLLPVGPACL